MNEEPTQRLARSRKSKLSYCAGSADTTLPHARYSTTFGSSACYNFILTKNEIKLKQNETRQRLILFRLSPANAPDVIVDRMRTKYTKLCCRR